MNIGVVITGSFCSFSQILPVLERMCAENDVTPIMSYNAFEFDTRFYKAADFVRELKRITGRDPIHTIAEAEKIGPQKPFDVMLVAPATGNTMAKMALGITDTPALMAIKAHLRNGLPVVVAPATNDALGASMQNIAALMNRKNIYFVPFSQDDCEKKPRSMMARFGLCEKAIEYALDKKQLQPVIL